MRKVTMGRYTHSLFYDSDGNTFMPLYRIWMKYRDYCKRNGRKWVDVTTFGRIINEMQKCAADYLVTDPNGVNFGKFRLRVELGKTYKAMPASLLLNKEYYPVIKLVSTQKRKKIMRVNFWKFFPGTPLRKKIMKHLIKNPGKVFEFRVSKIEKKRNFVDDNFFNDF